MKKKFGQWWFCWGFWYSNLWSSWWPFCGNQFQRNEKLPLFIYFTHFFSFLLIIIFSLTLETLGVELRCTSPALRVIIITLVMGNLLALVIIACNVCDFNGDDGDNAGRDKATRILVKEPVDVNARKAKLIKILITWSSGGWSSCRSTSTSTLQPISILATLLDNSLRYQAINPT